MAKVIETRDLAVAFGEGNQRSLIFRHLNVSVEAGEFVTLVGVSGAGKTTLLRVIADLIPPHAGSIRVAAEIDPARRPIAMVFQSALLMPWRTVTENIMLGLEGLKLEAGALNERAQDALDLVGLGEYGNRWPYQLSGGQRQRIGIARALAVDPDILLMDEPFGALDAITRTGMQDELLRIWKTTKKSILFVTHDIEEAAYLGDRVLLLGGTPAEIIKEFEAGDRREFRRDSPAFAAKVDAIRSGLSAALDLVASR